tara:strand:- start:527 stop:829 length:303 start_codon:yes stop_codon:yes gene_type:complete
MQSKYTTKEIIEKYTKPNGEFAWGIETVIDALTHNVEYQVDVKGGVFTLTKWHSQKPTSQEIREEYIRQQIIGECLFYFKTEKGLKGFFKKLRAFFPRRS